MKLKKIILILFVLCILLCIGSVSATQDNDTLAGDNADVQLTSDSNMKMLSENESSTENDANTPDEDINQPNTLSSSNVAPLQKKTTKIDAFALCGNSFIKKTNHYFTVKVCSFNEKTEKIMFHKNVKLTVKVKIGKTIKTYKVTTNSNGEAKILNIKNLKVGAYPVTVNSRDEKFNVKDKGKIYIFNNNQKTITIKMNKSKKVKGGSLEAFYSTRDAQESKGVHVQSYSSEGHDGDPHLFITKAKFFFKNKKTGKIITKTSKTKISKLYGWDYPYSKLINGYTPIKAKIWYVTR